MAYSQTPTLEMFSGSANTALNGPITTNRVITFQRNTDNPTGSTTGAYSPAVTVTYSLSNQQFTSVEGVPGTPGVVYGGTSTVAASGNNNAMGQFLVFPTVGGISSSANTNYTTCATCTPGTGMDISSNYAVSLFTIADALITGTGVQNFALNARVQYADLTFTFSRPVSNPIVHLTGLGGNSSYTYNNAFYTIGFSSEIDMVTPGLTFTALSGSTYFTVSPTSISNSATDIGANTAGAVFNGIQRFAASGSVQVTGTNITSFTVRLFLKGDGGRITSTSTGAIVPPTGSNVVRWALHEDFIPTSPSAGPGTLQENVSGDVFLVGVSLRAPVTVSGNVFNDVNGGFVNNSSGTTNAVPGGMFANLIDASGRVVASVAVNTDGTYTLPAIFEGTYTVNISQTQGVQGAAAPAITLPAGWGSTGEFNGAANTGNDGSPNGISAAFTVGGSNFGNVNFGIQRLPESAVNTQVVGNNGGGTIATTVNPLWFVNSTSGTNPNTQDYDGGTITSIRITAFPSNATSITINGVTYTSATWPVAGVTIPYTTGVGPTQPILVDPVNGPVDVVIPFASIDNAGGEDPTPGSVTLTYTSVLPVRLSSFTAVMENSGVKLEWVVELEDNVMKYEVEQSRNGSTFEFIGQNAASNNRSYTFFHASPFSGMNYYRLKAIDNDGTFSYSKVVVVNALLNIEAPVKVYPVPARDYVYVSVNRGLQNKLATINLINADGSVVFSRQMYKLSQTESFYVGNLPDGNYILRIVTRDKSQVSKIKVIK